MSKKIIFIILILFLFSPKVFSQGESPFKTPGVFKLSYLNYENKIVDIEDVKLTAIDSNSLTFDEVAAYGPSSAQNTYKPRTVIFEKIKSFGYKDGLSRGDIIRNGTIIGVGIGFVLGFSIGKFSITGDGSSTPSTFSDRAATGAGFGLLFGIPAFVLTTLFSFDAKEYESLNISQYSSAKKFEILKTLIKKGVKKNS